MSEHRLVVTRDLSRTGGEEARLGALEDAVTDDVESYSDDGRLQACLILAGIVGKNVLKVDDNVLRRVENKIPPGGWTNLIALNRLSVAAIGSSNDQPARSLLLGSS